MSLKIGVIGAGSIGFTRKIMHDILAAPELADAEFRFNDINENTLKMITQLAQRDIKANDLPAKITPCLNRRKALEGADYVINTVRIGGIEAFNSDVEIPLKYGIHQCVGDTLCAGGIMYGQRNIPAILDFCKDIRQVAADDCLFLNYANPNAMNAWAANHHGKVNTLGLCHGVQHGHQQITDVIEFLINGDTDPESDDYVSVEKKEVDIICAGINHQTWYIQILYDGQDWTERLLEGFETHPEYSRTEKVRIDMLRRFGYYTTESNGHVSEYVPWYRKRPEELDRWIDRSVWVHGETGGYLKTIKGRDSYEDNFKKWMQEDPPVISTENRSIEHGGHIIEARETGRTYRGHFNVVNNGCITNLPEEAIVEVPGYVDRNGINIPQVGKLPMACAAICNASISVQRLAVEAAINGDYNLLVQAMMLDPLTGAVCNPPEIARMTDEMLVAQAKWLPQYKNEIERAKSRLKTCR